MRFKQFHSWGGRLSPPALLQTPLGLGYVAAALGIGIEFYEPRVEEEDTYVSEYVLYVSYVSYICIIHICISYSSISIIRACVIISASF